MTVLVGILVLVAVAQLGVLIYATIRGNLKTDYLFNIVNNLRYLDDPREARDPAAAPEDSRYIASLTSIESRLHVADKAIRSMLDQDVPPQGVYLYLSDQIAPAAVPAKLRALEERGLTIRFVEDVGPHTKLIQALQDHAGTRIITFDDDMIYPSNMAACLLQHARRFPQCVVANWARRLRFALGRVQPVRRGTLLTPPRMEWNIEQHAHLPTPSMRTFAYGTLGVLYPPGALDPRVCDRKLMHELCPTEDDIWFKAMSILGGSRTVETNLGVNPRHFCVTGSQAAALRHANHGERKNQRQLRAVFDAFGLYQLIRRDERRAP